MKIFDSIVIIVTLSIVTFATFHRTFPDLTGLSECSEDLHITCDHKFIAGLTPGDGNSKTCDSLNSYWAPRQIFWNRCRERHSQNHRNVATQRAGSYTRTGLLGTTPTQRHTRAPAASVCTKVKSYCARQVAITIRRWAYVTYNDRTI